MKKINIKVGDSVLMYGFEINIGEAKVLKIAGQSVAYFRGTKINRTCYKYLVEYKKKNWGKMETQTLWIDEDYIYKILK